MGKEAHRPAWIAGPEGDPVSAATILHRCFPLRRQHAGSFESASEADTSGPISEKLKLADSSSARRWRIRPRRVTPIAERSKSEGS